MERGSIKLGYRHAFANLLILQDDGAILANCKRPFWLPAVRTVLLILFPAAFSPASKLVDLASSLNHPCVDYAGLESFRGTDRRQGLLVVLSI